MEVYKSESREVIDRFFAQRLGFPECIASLNEGLADLIPRLQPEEIDALREVMLGNNQIIMKEVERRGPPKENSK